MEIILSSSKRGYGLKELLSTSKTEYWNTDDTLPHFIGISFQVLTYVHSVRLLFQYSLDESYTPSKVAVLFNGTRREFNISQPEGFVTLSVEALLFDLHVIILANHAEGKDSHVRALKVMANPEEEIKPTYDNLWSAEHEKTGMFY